MIPLLLAQASLHPRFEMRTPLPGAPGIMVDAYGTGLGAANQTARARGWQARILWIDATANLERVNSEDKIRELTRTIAGAGFNTVVFDVKPISGQVLYKSKLAPKLTEWRGRTMDPAFDPLPIMARECRRRGLGIYVSLNAFSEGHRMFLVGPGYARPEEQTVLYEVRGGARGRDGALFPTAGKPNVYEAGKINVATQLPAQLPNGFGVTLRPNGRAVDGFLLQPGLPKPTIPRGGVLVYGEGAAADFLAANLVIGAKLPFDTEPVFVPISERPEQQIPLMMNPLDPRVREYAFGIVRELNGYDVDGIVYDDRLRFGNLNADFSPVTRAAFEREVGRKLNWPNDVLKFTLTQTLGRGVRPGPYYDRWMAFRARTLTGFLRDVRGLLPKGRQLGVYAGSWYGEYPSLGSNWAAPDVASGFWFATPEYRQTGFAADLDFLITGCYYRTATIYDAMERGLPIGPTVEAGGTLTNQLAGDRTWSYAGIALSDFKDDPEGLERALAAACASTQGVMVFDLSHDIEPMWPTFSRAFSVPRPAPHARMAASKLRPQRGAPVMITAGSAGTGQ